MVVSHLGFIQKPRPLFLAQKFALLRHGLGQDGRRRQQGLGLRQLLRGLEQDRRRERHLDRGREQRGLQRGFRRQQASLTSPSLECTELAKLDVDGDG